METSIIRKNTSLSEEIIEVLNQQIAVEAHSSAAYLGMSAWCHLKGYIHAGDFFRHQSEEETIHKMKLFDYILDMGAHALAPEVHQVANNFDDLRAVLDNFLEMEINITNRFNKIAKKCFEASDFQTFSFVQWFLDEQKEEEDTARRTIEIYDLIGIELDGLFQIDKAIGKLIPQA
jgi:ferritin